MRPAIKSTPIRKSRFSQKGAVAVEMAIALPLFALLLLGTMELGSAARDHQILQNAAREGARLSSLPTFQIGGDPNALATIRARVVAYLQNEGITSVAPGDIAVDQNYPMTIGILTIDGSEVIVNYNRTLIFPGIANFIPLGTMQLRGRAVFRNFY